MRSRSAVRASFAGCVAACMTIASGCRPADAAKARGGDSSELAQREARLERELVQRPASGTAGATKPLARWIMPKDLDELSGFALTPDGRLLAHGDEHAKISEVDYRRGVITKQFELGKPTVKGDFEAIAAVEDRFYLLASNGTLYEFKEGKNGERVDYNMHDTKLGKDCEFEGLAFDPAINSLLLACKHVHKKRLKEDVLIYRWPIEKGEHDLSELTVPLASIPTAVRPKGQFHPSDITIDPFTGNYVIISSLEKAIMEITPAGQVVFARPLPGEHDQAEALAITKDSILIIGDEATRRPAVITLYRWP